MNTDQTTGSIPWRLQAKDRHRHAARMLRTQARLDEDKSIGVSLEQQVLMWRLGLLAEGSVIHYDPDTEEGFWKVPRRPGVDLGWVREPSLNDDGTLRQQSQRG